MTYCPTSIRVDDSLEGRYFQENILRFDVVQSDLTGCMVTMRFNVWWVDQCVEALWFGQCSCHGIGGCFLSKGKGGVIIIPKLAHFDPLTISIPIPMQICSRWRQPLHIISNASCSTVTWSALNLRNVVPWFCTRVVIAETGNRTSSVDSMVNDSKPDAETKLRNPTAKVKSWSLLEVWNTYHSM